MSTPRTTREAAWIAYLKMVDNRVNPESIEIYACKLAAAGFSLPVSDEAASNVSIITHADVPALLARIRELEELADYCLQWH